MPDITVSSTIDTFMQSSDMRACRTNIGMKSTSIIPCSTSAWTAASGLTGAPANNNSLDWMHRQLISISANSRNTKYGYVRQLLNMSGSGNWLPGGIDSIDCGKGWRVQFTGNWTAASAEYKWTALVGGVTGAGAPTSAAARSSKGWQICITGTGAGTGTVSLVAHNGTSAITGASQSVSFLDGRLAVLEMEWTPASGLRLYIDGSSTAAASVTTSDGTMPSGTITGSANGWAMLLESIQGAVGSHSQYSQQAYIRPVTVLA